MTVEDYLVRWIGFFDAAFMYYVIQLGRAVVISAGMLVLIWMLRKTVLKHTVFLKGAVWGILLLAPFMGKMRFIYETRFGVRMLYYWQYFCGEHKWIPVAYILGMLVTAFLIFGKRRRLGKEVRKFNTIELCGMQTAVCEYTVSPFAMGLFRPVVVIPRVMLDRMSGEELQTILLHERMHIRLGHLWCFWLWDVLRIMLWANPLLFICTEWFRSDMEEICDWVTIQKGDKNAYIYGSLLLKSMQLIAGEHKEPESSVAFAGDNDYRKVKRRIEKISIYRPYSKIGLGMFAAGFALLFVMAFLTVKHLSYPSYTYMDNIQIYSRTGSQLLVADCEELRGAVQIDEEKVYIDRKKLDCIFREQNINEDAFFLFWGGFMKVPGFGGGIEGIFVDYRQQEGNLLLSYVSSDTDPVMWLLKRL